MGKLLLRLALHLMQYLHVPTSNSCHIQRVVVHAESGLPLDGSYRIVAHHVGSTGSKQQRVVFISAGNCYQHPPCSFGWPDPERLKPTSTTNRDHAASVATRTTTTATTTTCTIPTTTTTAITATQQSLQLAQQLRSPPQVPKQTGQKAQKHLKTKHQL